MAGAPYKQGPNAVRVQRSGSVVCARLLPGGLDGMPGTDAGPSVMALSDGPQWWPSVVALSGGPQWWPLSGGPQWWPLVVAKTRLLPCRVLCRQTGLGQAAAVGLRLGLPWHFTDTSRLELSNRL